jgi:hypothetical protein
MDSEESEDFIVDTEEWTQLDVKIKKLKIMIKLIENEIE